MHAAPRGADEIAEPIKSRDRGAVEGCDQGRAGEVRRVVLDIANAFAHVGFGEAEHRCNGGRQRANSAGIKGAIRERASGPMTCDKPGLAPEVRAHVARNGKAIDLPRFEPGETQTFACRERWKAGAMLDAPEALLFHRGHELAVTHKHGRNVAVIRVQSEDVHALADIESAAARACGNSRRPIAFVNRRAKCRSSNSVLARTAPA